MNSRLLATAAISTFLLAAGCSKAAPDNAAAGNATVPAAASTPSANSAPIAGREDLLKDAVSALQETDNAIDALDRKDTKSATAALERATGKLELVLARNPHLALAPVDVSVETYDVLGTVDAVKALRASAEEALSDGRVQDARHLIASLASETVVHVSNLPLATYPDAIKSAAVLVSQNKVDEAKAVLATALNTIVIQDVIHPLPLLRASVATEAARKLAAVPNRTAADDAKIQQLLETARTQLKLGQELGYATKDEMKTLLKTIDEIEDGVKNKASGASVFDRIKGLFEKANSSSQPKRGS